MDAGCIQRRKDSGANTRRTCMTVYICLPDAARLLELNKDSVYRALRVLQHGFWHHIHQFHMLASKFRPKGFGKQLEIVC